MGRICRPLFLFFLPLASSLLPLTCTNATVCMWIHISTVCVGGSFRAIAALLYLSTSRPLQIV
jgi:hypothetical protein